MRRLKYINATQISLLIFVFMGNIGPTLAESTDDIDTARSASGWIADRGTAYKVNELPPDIIPIVAQMTPSDVQVMGFKGIRVVHYKPMSVAVLKVRDLEVIAAAYRATPKIGLGSQGALLMRYKGEAIYQATDPSVSPIYGDDQWPALFITKGDTRVVMLQAYSDWDNVSYLYSFSLGGKLLSMIETPGNGEYRILPAKGKGKLIITGYGLAEKDRSQLDNKERVDIKALSTELGVTLLTPSLGTGASGRFEVMALNEDGIIQPLHGNAASIIYQAEADRVAASMKETIAGRSREGVINAALSFFGILTGIDDQQIIKSKYDELPAEVRGQINPKELARYWQIVGYPVLINIFE